MTANLDDIDLVVLCGGRGTRMRSATEMVPKALVPVAGRPIIDHVVNSFVGKGLARVTLCVGYLGEQIRRHFDRLSPDVSFSFSDSGEHASMLARIFAVRDQVGSRLLVTYCDTYTDLNLEQLLSQHDRRAPLATLVTTKITSPFGITEIEVGEPGGGGAVLSFEEKPMNDFFIGTFLLERASLKAVDQRLLALPDGEGLVAFFDLLVEDSKLDAFVHSGKNITFNTQEEHGYAEQALDRFFTLNE